MPARPSPQLTGNAGEHCVAAELCRRGFQATTFAGNVPGYDVVAVTPRRRSFTVQVKTQTGGDWAINISERLQRPTRNMFWVLVLIRKNHQDEPPRFWIVPDADMRAILQAEYDAKPESYTGNAGHFFQLREKTVAGWEDRWECLK